MTTIEDEAGFVHLESLLPWYANGTLDSEEILRIEQGLAQLPELQRRYQLILEERSAATAVNESLGAPSPQIVEKLFARIDGATARAPKSRGFNIGDWLAARFSVWQPRSVALAALGASFIALIETGLLVLAIFGAGQKGTTYWTASAEKNTAEQNGAFVLVAFVPSATAANILHFLDAHNMSIVDGPAVGGLFRIRVSDKALTTNELGALAASLRKEGSIVRFVAPTT
jgi:hypothetical protein